MSASKAIKSGRLAVGEETLGNEEAADAAGRVAGKLAFAAGMSLDTLDAQVGHMSRSCIAWGAAVDSWYDAQAASRVPADAAASLVAALRAEGKGNAADVVASLLAEVLRARARAA